MRKVRIKAFGSFLITALILMNLSLPVTNAGVFDDPALRLDSVTVSATGGYPALYINNVKTPFVMFTQWKISIPDTPITKYPNYEGSAQYAGIHLYQVRANVGSTVDKLQPLFDDVIAKDPKARFLVPIWVATPSELAMTHNGENEANVDTTSRDHVSFGSEKWRKNAGLTVRQLVRDMNYSAYRDRVIGFMLTAGSTGEWMDPLIFSNTDFDRSLGNQIGFRNFLKDKYTTTANLRTAWNNATVTLDTAVIPAKATNGPFLDPTVYQNVIDFMEYDSLIEAKSIEYLCSVVKDETNNKRICGAPYGYTFETGKFNNISGHLAFSYLLDSPYVDYFASPFTYNTRQLDGYTGWHGFADSTRNHGKLWLGEDDTQTHVNTPPPGSIDESIKFATNENESEAILWKNFMAGLTKNFGHWWYDNTGQGHLNTPQLMHQVAMMNALAEAANSKTSQNWTEVALVVDERSQFYQTPADSTINHKLLSFRQNLGKMGIPFDVLSLDDVVAGQANNYKMYIFANAFALTSAQRTAIKNLRHSGKAFVWINFPGLIDISTKSASYTALQDITWLDLRLASADGSGNLTEVPVGNLFSGFTNSSPPHMFAIANPNDTVWASSHNGKTTVIKSNKTTWFSYFADDISLLTPALLRQIATDASVHITSLNNRFVSGDNRFLAVTLPGGGTTEEIRFPINGTVYEVLSDTEYSITANSLFVNASLPRTYVFYFGTRAGLGMTRPTVPSSSAHHIDLSKGETANLKMYPTQTKKLDPDIQTADNFEVTEGKTITWSSDNPAIATVNGSGVVTAVAAGTTTIRASSVGLTGTRVVEVVPGNTFKTVRFASPSISIAKGSTAAPVLQRVNLDGSTQTLNSSSAVWASKNPDIASVNSSGVITANYDGAVNITAEYMGERAWLGVSVNDTVNIPRDIWFTNAGYVRFNTPSGTFALNVHAVDKNVVETDVTSSANYTSSNPAVATVSSSGVITPVGNGIALITAGLYNKYAYCLVEVSRVEFDPMNITVNTSMTVGQTQTPTVTPKTPQFWSTTASWNVLSGTSVQVTSGGASLHAVSAGVSKVEGVIDFFYPRYDITANSISGRQGHIRPVYSVNAN